MARQQPVEVPELKNIDEAISWIMSNVGYVQKKSAKNLNYTFAGEAALIQAVRPWMVLAGVTMHVAEIRNKVREQYETKSGTSMNSITLDALIRFVHTPSGTFVEVMSSGEGSDTGDKARNKALTGAYKYAIRQTFCIETGDDPDEHASDKMERKKQGAEKQPESPKERLVRELKPHYKDVGAIAAAMKQEPAITFDADKFDEIKAELIISLLRHVVPDAMRRRRAWRARKDGRKPFAGYIKEEDGSIHVLLLADASEFVYRQLKRYEPVLLASFQARWAQYNIVKVTVVPRINNEDARNAIGLGGTFRVFRRERIQSRRNT